ncbi:unnamed protein product [Periconia digitata]|uniref:Diphthamide biosynthesis protein 4 n=1 Tax=Periconia digitata TaxID=1303443 RepID=A0A9W4UTA7_9PLEO|nr:unnamed protein product [Periconia digitata]
MTPTPRRTATEPTNRTSNRDTARMNDHYSVLGLQWARPSSQKASGHGQAGRHAAPPTPLHPDALKKAYRSALLKAHPDKAPPVPPPYPRGNTTASAPSPCTPSTTTTAISRAETETEAQQPSIDAIKLAYAVLGNPAQKKEYDASFRLSLHAHSYSSSFSAAAAAAAAAAHDSSISSFDLEALDIFDLDDFTISSSSSSSFPRHRCRRDPTDAENNADGNASAEEEEEEDDDGGGAKSEWCRRCHRCGADPGFRVDEVELERAVAADVEEVVLGCAGCSLFVRVQFGVE